MSTAIPSSLSNVTILITSFLRPGYLRECLNGLKFNLPECKVVVVDDGDDIIYGVDPEIQMIRLPFDSGLPAKRNTGVKACSTPYLLLGCDDFDFRPKEVREGIEQLVDVLTVFPRLSVAGGRVDKNPYEGDLEYIPGYFIKETRLKSTLPGVHKVDLTVNYFLARTDDIRDVPWDERMKIGGEHGDWFLEMKLREKWVAWVSGVNINTLNMRGEGLQDPRYGEFRGRAVELGHKIFMEKRDIKRYIGFGDPR